MFNRQYRVRWIEFINSILYSEQKVISLFLKTKYLENGQMKKKNAKS